MINTTECPICHTCDNVAEWTTNDCTNKIKSLECLICDIAFAQNMLSESSYVNFYDNYNSDRDNNKKELELLRKKCYLLDKNFIDENCKSKFNSVLDFGCGTGKFLSLFDDCSYRLGFDIDSSTIKSNIATYENITFTDDVNEISEKFDLIIFRGTIQYMRDIEKIKVFVESHLKNNGYLAILSVPNKNSPLATIQKENWSLYNPIEMFNIFSLKSLSTVFNNFKIINVDYPYINTPYSDEYNDIKKFIDLVKHGKQSKFPFWGSMMNVLYQKVQ